MYDSIDIKIKYSSEEDNLLEDFYLKVLSKSCRYDRAVGYFSSSVLKEYLLSLVDFYNNNGKIRLIISPELSIEDIAVLRNTIEVEVNEECRKIALKHLLKLFEDTSCSCTDLFFNLILSGMLEVKIAIVKDNQGIFHEKYGLFYESNGDKIIAINGSNNETYRGIGKNQESFNTFCSWIVGQEGYVEQHIEDFEKYWNNISRKLLIVKIDRNNFNEIFENVEKVDIEQEFKKLRNDKKYNVDDMEAKLLGLDFKPFTYQMDAAKKLLHNGKGILKFATGSGKTKTAIIYMQMVKKSSSKTFFLIVVPDKTLAHQWEQEIQKYNENIVTTFSDNPQWKLDLRRAVSIYNSKTVANEVIISTRQTMFNNGKESHFLKEISKLEDFIIIVDECHNFSTELVMDNIPLNTIRRVGLSATPNSDLVIPVEEQMLNYFGGVIAEYTLSDAIKEERLCRYNYYPIITQLDDDEKEAYDALSKTIATLVSKNKENSNDMEIRKQLDLLNFKRARIIYGAKQKITKLKELIENGSIKKKYLLIYCGATSSNDEDDTQLTQLNTVNHLLTEIGVVSAQYTSYEDLKARRNAIELFKKGTISTLVAIKCLDEGVDIPEISNAIILASTNNKREFIQRRGRILRKHSGKDIVNIYDMVVRDYENVKSSLNINETRRMIEYMNDANNFEEIYNENFEFIDLVNKEENVNEE